jgi:hypothetical protein
MSAKSPQVKKVQARTEILSAETAPGVDLRSTPVFNCNFFLAFPELSSHNQPGRIENMAGEEQTERDCGCVRETPPSVVLAQNAHHGFQVFRWLALVDLKLRLMLFIWDSRRGLFPLRPSDRSSILRFWGSRVSPNTSQACLVNHPESALSVRSALSGLILPPNPSILLAALLTGNCYDSSFSADYAPKRMS